VSPLTINRRLKNKGKMNLHYPKKSNSNILLSPSSK